MVFRKITNHWAPFFVAIFTILFSLCGQAASLPLLGQATIQFEANKTTDPALVHLGDGNGSIQIEEGLVLTEYESDVPGKLWVRGNPTNLSGNYFLISEAGVIRLIKFNGDEVAVTLFEVRSSKKYGNYSYSGFTAFHTEEYSILRLFDGLESYAFVDLVIPHQGKFKNRVFVFDKPAVELTEHLKAHRSVDIKIINADVLEFYTALDFDEKGTQLKIRQVNAIRQIRKTSGKGNKNTAVSSQGIKTESQKPAVTKSESKVPKKPTAKGSAGKAASQSRVPVAAASPVPAGMLPTRSNELLNSKEVSSAKFSESDDVKPGSLSEFIRKKFDVIQSVPPMPDDLAHLSDHLEDAIIHLNKAKNNSLAVTGEPGVGKSHFLEIIKSHLAKSSRVLISLTAPSLDSGSGGVIGPFENKVDALKKLSAIVPVTLFIDEVHSMIGRGKHSKNDIDFFEMIKSELSSGRIQVVGTTTNQNWNRFFVPNSDLVQRFGKEPLQLRQPSEAELLTLIPKAIKSMHPTLGELPRELVVEAIAISSRFNPLGSQPRKSLDLLDQYASSILTAGSPMTKEGLLKAASRMYRYDISALSAKGIADRVRGLEVGLDEDLVGLGDVKVKTAKAIANHLLFNQENSKKPLTILYYGDKGAGKTVMSQSVARHMGYMPERILMSQFTSSTDGPKLLSRIGAIIKKNPFAVILLDEVEKSHRLVQDSLLQVFDEGLFEANLTDGISSGQTEATVVDASKAIFFLATNAGAEIANGESSASLAKIADEENLSKYLLDRADAAIPFPRLSDEELKSVVKVKWDRKVKEFSKIGYVLQIDHAQLYDYITSLIPVEQSSSIGFTSDRSVEVELVSVRFFEREIKRISEEISYQIMMHPNSKEQVVELGSAKLFVRPNRESEAKNDCGGIFKPKEKAPAKARR